MPESANPLDNTGVHPESYKSAKELLSLVDYSDKEIKSAKFPDLAARVKAKGTKTLAETLGIGLPTLDDMMSASKGKMVLFTELKGSTADRKMADDAVALIRKYQMEDECVLISLKYGLIDYIETTYPDIQTGFLQRLQRHFNF